MNTDIQRYAQAAPQYREPLEFLQGVLDFQAALADKIEPGLRIELALAREKWQAGQSLLAGESLAISPSLFWEALVDLRSRLPPGGSAQVALDRMLMSDSRVSSNARAWLDALVAASIRYPQGGAAIQRLADALSSDPDTLALLLRTVLSPFFQKEVALYREWAGTVPWRRGTCPMCGSEPWMARLAGQEGRRILACFLCRTEWAFDRLRCPFCEQGDQPLVRYFTADDDQVHRVACCDRCQRYIKTVDERASGQAVNLLMEDVITAHLDTLAREQGYQ